jgi:hypothetical protein
MPAKPLAIEERTNAAKHRKELATCLALKRLSIGGDGTLYAKAADVIQFLLPSFTKPMPELLGKPALVRQMSVDMPIAEALNHQTRNKVGAPACGVSEDALGGDENTIDRAICALTRKCTAVPERLS